MNHPIEEPYLRILMLRRVAALLAQLPSEAPFLTTSEKEACLEIGKNEADRLFLGQPLALEAISLMRQIDQLLPEEGVTLLRAKSTIWRAAEAANSSRKQLRTQRALHQSAKLWTLSPHEQMGGVAFGGTRRILLIEGTAALIWISGSMYTSGQNRQYGETSLDYYPEAFAADPNWRRRVEITSGGRLSTVRLELARPMLLKWFTLAALAGLTPTKTVVSGLEAKRLVPATLTEALYLT